MTRVLALVEDRDGAATAIAGGVDRLVVRPDPKADGTDAALAAIGRMAAGRCPVSLWAPALPFDPAAALAACGGDEAWNVAPGTMPPGVPCWAVLTPADVAVGDLQGYAGVVLHAGDGPPRFLESAGIARLERLRREARAAGLLFGISGSMEAPDVPRLLAFAPDILVFGDLLRRDGLMGGAVDPDRVRLVRDLVDRGVPAPGTTAMQEEPDRIFVRDWTVALRLGAYGHERAAQRVRFTVEAEVVRTAPRAADMRDIVTYDLIIDAIARATVDHVALVETIAEDVAAMVLAHPSVQGVDVTVEKLDVGPGSLGCRIRRRRAA